MYGFVYITTNHINGKRYIGKKVYDKAGRWKQYLGSGIHLKRAIDKYGKQNFTKEIIENCSTRKSLNEREKYWIDFYDAIDRDDFYNIASGGDGGDVRVGYSDVQFKRSEEFRKARIRETIPRGEESCNSRLTTMQVYDIISRLKNNEFNADIAKDYGVSDRTIDDIRLHKTWRHLTNGMVFDDISNRNGKHSKPIDIYDLNGNFVETLESARDAEIKYGIPYRNVSQVCNGQKRQSHGYICRFAGENFYKYNTLRKNGELCALR